MPRRLLVILMLLIVLAVPAANAAAPAAAPEPEPQPAPLRQERPFGLPFAEPPGPSTWLLGQTYGNTTGAYRQRNTTYVAGQGLHFGVDFSASCGTPIVSIGDGVVAKVDAPEHRALPHNLMIDHPNGFASFYGHLYERPDLTVGQPVKQGEVVAKVGDPDGSCSSRPHLHLEIRDVGVYRHTYNPVTFIDADWDSLALIGSFSTGFTRDLDDPRRWQYFDDQPEEIQMGGALLNDYARSWPLDWGGGR